MDKIKEQVIESCISEICKEENKKIVTQQVIDPITEHIFKKFQMIFLCIAIFMVLLYFKVTCILFFALRKN